MSFITTKSESDTAKLAAKLAQQVSAPCVILLSGNLGAGKSVFARAFIRTICGDHDLDVPSPTFTLIQSYDSSAGEIYHFDLYRLEEPDEIFELGWEDMIREGICLVEWPERLGSYIPKNHKRVCIDISEDSRTIMLEGFND